MHIALRFEMDKMSLSDEERLNLYNEIIRISLEDENSIGVSQIERMVLKKLETEQVRQTIDAIEQHIIEARQTRTYNSLLSKALSALGYLLTGLWQSSPDEESLHACCTSSLVPHLLEVSNHCPLEHKLLVLVIVSNQATPLHFRSFMEQIVKFIGNLVHSSHATSDNHDLIIHQSTAALMNLQTQNPCKYKEFVELPLAYNLYNYLLSKLTSSEEPAPLLRTDNITFVKELLMALSAMPKTILQYLANLTHQRIGEVGKAFRRLIDSSNTSTEVLDEITDIWYLILLIYSTLLPSDDEEARQDTERMRRNATLASSSDSLIADFYTYLPETDQKRDNRLSPVERKLVFYDLIAPASTAGKMIVPLQHILVVSRGRAAACYKALCRQLLVDKKWYSPHQVWKLLLRCCQHLLLNLPPVLQSIVKTNTLPTDNESVLKAMEDTVDGVGVIGEALAELIASIPLEDIEEAYKTVHVSVKIDNNSATKEKITLQWLIDQLSGSFSMAAEPSQANLSAQNLPEDDETIISPPQKRPKLNRNSENSLTPWQITKAIKKERFKVYCKCCKRLLTPYKKYWGINKDGDNGSSMVGLFAYNMGFRKKDILSSDNEERLNSPIGNLAMDDLYTKHFKSFNKLTLPCILHSIQLFSEKDLVSTADSIISWWQSLVLLTIRRLFAKLSTQHSHSNSTSANQILSSNIFTSSQISSPILLSHPNPPHPSTTNMLANTFSQTSVQQLYHFTQYQKKYEEVKDEDQVVLYMIQADATVWILRIVEDCLQMLVQVSQTLHSLSTENANEKVILVELMFGLVESMWWVLHRLSAFALELSENEVNSYLRDFMELNGLEKIEIPSNLAGMMIILTLSVAQQFSATHCHSKISLLTTAISYSMNSLTESGTLSHIIYILYHYFFLFYPNPPAASCTLFLLPLENMAFSYSSLVLYAFMVKRVVFKLSDLTAPNASESLSVGVLMNLLSALRSILLLPCYLMNYLGDSVDILSLLTEEGSTEISNSSKSFVDCYQYLTNIWYSLECRNLDYSSNENVDSVISTLYPLNVLYIAAADHRAEHSKERLLALEKFNIIVITLHGLFANFHTNYLVQSQLSIDKQETMLYKLAKQLNNYVHVQHVLYLTNLMRNNNVSMVSEESLLRLSNHLYQTSNASHASDDVLYISIPSVNSNNSSNDSNNIIIERIDLRSVLSVLLLYIVTTNRIDDKLFDATMEYIVSSVKDSSISVKGDYMENQLRRLAIELGFQVVDIETTKNRVRDYMMKNSRKRRERGNEGERSENKESEGEKKEKGEEGSGAGNRKKDSIVVALDFYDVEEEMAISRAEITGEKTDELEERDEMDLVVEDEDEDKDEDEDEEEEEEEEGKKSENDDNGNNHEYKREEGREKEMKVVLEDQRDETVESVLVVEDAGEDERGSTSPPNNTRVNNAAIEEGGKNEENDSAASKSVKDGIKEQGEGVQVSVGLGRADTINVADILAGLAEEHQQANLPSLHPQSPLETSFEEVRILIQQYVENKDKEHVKPSSAVGKLIEALQGTQRLSLLLSKEIESILAKQAK